MKVFFALVALVVAINATSDHLAWSDFKVKFSRNYQLHEEQFRFRVFQKKLREIEEHNARYEKGELTYFLKVTQFADFTEDEFRSYLNNQTAGMPTLFNIPVEAFKPDPNVKIPESLDWRSKNAVLGIRNQKACGSCWDFSAMAALESQLAIHKNQHDFLSVQEVLDCSLGNCEGAYPNVALNYVKDNGIALDEDYPYTAIEGSCNKKNVSRVLDTISKVLLVTSLNDVVEAIATIGPVACSVCAGKWASYGGGIFKDATCGTIPNHAIAAIGYTKDYFIIKNSWGTTWGEGGYMKIARAERACGMDQINYVPVL